MGKFLQKPGKIWTLSIIDSLSAGYRFITGRLYLLVIPILLDLFLWFAPRLSIAPALEGLAELYRQAAQMEELSGDLVAMAEQASDLMGQVGQQSNLFNLIVSSTLFHVPSVMILIEPLPTASVRELSGAFGIGFLTLGLSFVGLYVGVLYFGLLGDGLPIGNGAKSRSGAEFVALSLRRLMRTLLLVVAVIFLFLAILIPTSLGVTFIAIISPALASLLMALLSGLIFIALFYLYFATAGIVLDDLSTMDAVGRSVRLMRSYFWPAVGFIILINLIGRGFSLIWVPLMDFAPIGILVAIVGNAYIGTGLAMALLVFYRTRTMMIEDDHSFEEMMETI